MCVLKRFPFLLLLSCLKFFLQVEIGHCGDFAKSSKRSWVIRSQPKFDEKGKNLRTSPVDWDMTGEPGQIVCFQIVRFSIGRNCKKSFLSLEETELSRSMHICNLTRSRYFYSGGKHLKVGLKTGNSTPKLKFKFTYMSDRSFNTSWCGGPYRLGGNSGRIEQTFVGEEAKCVWLIENKKSSVIRLRIWKLPSNENLKLFRNENRRTPSKSVTRENQDLYCSGEKLKIGLSSSHLSDSLYISYEVIHRSELASLQTRPRNLVNVENGSTVNILCNPPMITAVGRVNLTIGDGSINIVKNPDNTTEASYGKGNKFSQHFYSISGTQRSGLATTFVATMKYEGEIRCTVEKKENKSDQLFPEPMVMSKSVILTVIVSPKIFWLFAEPESPKEGEMIDMTCIYSPGIPRNNITGIGYLRKLSPNTISRGNETESATWRWVVHSSQQNRLIGCKIGDQEITSKVDIKSSWLTAAVVLSMVLLALITIVMGFFVMRSCLQRQMLNFEKPRTSCI